MRVPGFVMLCVTYEINSASAEGSQPGRSVPTTSRGGPETAVDPYKIGANKLRQQPTAPSEALSAPYRDDFLLSERRKGEGFRVGRMSVTRPF